MKHVSLNEVMSTITFRVTEKQRILRGGLRRSIVDTTAWATSLVLPWIFVSKTMLKLWRCHKLRSHIVIASTPPPIKESRAQSIAAIGRR